MVCIYLLLTYFLVCIFFLLIIIINIYLLTYYNIITNLNGSNQFIFIHINIIYKLRLLYHTTIGSVYKG